MKLASNYPTRQQAVVDGGGLFVVVAASKRGAAAAERAALPDDRAQVSRGEELQRTMRPRADGCVTSVATKHTEADAEPPVCE